MFKSCCFVLVAEKNNTNNNNNKDSNWSAKMGVHCQTICIPFIIIFEPPGQFPWLKNNNRFKV